MRHRNLFKDSSLDIEYNVLNDIIVANWHGPQTEETIMHGYEKVLQFITLHFSKALLDNHEEISGLWAGASDWVAHEWFQRAKSKGLKFIAFIYSERKFSNLSTNKALTLINSPNVQGFQNKTAAERWLEDMLHMS